MSTTVLEDWVAAAIKTKMRHLSKTLDARIFRGYGPLSTFSAKIDIGYALELFDDTICSDLRALKDIRNAFAHTTDLVFFRSKSVAPEFQKLSGWTKDRHPHELFRERVTACVEALKVPLKNKALINALLGYRAADRNERSATFPAKSPAQSPQPQSLGRDETEKDG
jgi:hypothetical protein